MVANTVLGLAIAACVPLLPELAIVEIDVSMEVTMRIKGVWELVAWRAWLGERTYAAVGGEYSSVANGQVGHRGGSNPPPRSPWALPFAACRSGHVHQRMRLHFWRVPSTPLHVGAALGYGAIVRTRTQAAYPSS